MEKDMPVLPFTYEFDMTTGKSRDGETSKRYLSNLNGLFNDDAAMDKALEKSDPLIYEFFELHLPNTASDLLFGTSIVYPGKIGDEYFMTKGHFHQILDTAEVYYTLSGKGCMMMETPEGETSVKFLEPGQAVYVPPRWAHRSINTGSSPLITYFVFRADAGHDYGTIEEKGYRKLVVEGKDGNPEIIDNPKWKQLQEAYNDK